MAKTLKTGVILYNKTMKRIVVKGLKKRDKLALIKIKGHGSFRHIKAKKKK